MINCNGPGGLLGSETITGSSIVTAAGWFLATVSITLLGFLLATPSGGNTTSPSNTRISGVTISLLATVGALLGVAVIVTGAIGAGWACEADDPNRLAIIKPAYEIATPSFRKPRHRARALSVLGISDSDTYCLRQTPTRTLFEVLPFAVLLKSFLKINCSSVSVASVTKAI